MESKKKKKNKYKVKKNYKVDGLNLVQLAMLRDKQVNNFTQDLLQKIDDYFFTIVEPTKVELNYDGSEKNNHKIVILDKAFKNKLVNSYMMDCNISEIAMLCGVSRQTIYNWQKLFPDFFELLDLLRQIPYLLARENIVKKLKTDYDGEFSLKFLERKNAEEFGQRTRIQADIDNKVEHTHVLSQESIDALSGKQLDDALFSLLGKTDFKKLPKK